MHGSDAPSGLQIDADMFAGITGGSWAVRPPDTWRYRGLCWHWDAYRPERIILAKGGGFRYGVDLSNLKGDIGQAGVIISGRTRQPGGNIPVLRIDSMHQGTRQLASYLRAATSTPIIAVTGSVGKTSSCYLLQHLLGFEGRVTTNGQLNYPDGIVGEMGNLAEVDYMVIEASLQGLGEATATLKPDVALLTHISPVHMDDVGGLLALAEKKSVIFRDMAPNGTAVINRDIPYFDRVLEIAQQMAAAVVTFGDHPNADFQLTGYDATQQQVSACFFGDDIEYELGLPGRHMAINSLGALAAAHAAGVALKSLLPRCASARLVAGRGALERLHIGGIQVSLIDDAYNASPDAMVAAFATLAATSPNGCGRRIAVLSDMLELGEHAAKYHEQLVEPLIKSGVDKVYLAGDLMRSLWKQLPVALRTFMSGSTRRLLWPLVSDIKDGDVLLLKGSHGTDMHRLAADLRYLSLAPNVKGFTLRTFILIRNVIYRIEPYVPTRTKRWVSWHITKLMQR